MSFSIISQSFSFLVGVQISLFWQLGPKKRTPKKHYKNRGVSNPFFGKQICGTKRPFLDQKTQNQKFQLSFFFAFFSFNKKTQKCSETHILLCLSKPKKENFQNLNLEHRKLKT